MKNVVALVLAFSAGVGLLWLASRLVKSQVPDEPPIERRFAIQPRPFKPEYVPPAEFKECEIKPMVGSTADVEFDVVGFEDRWIVGPHGKTADTPKAADDAEMAVLRLPKNSNVRLNLQSRDFIYVIAILPLKRGQIAIPGQSSPLEFRTPESGEFLLRGNHFCGPPRPTLTIKGLVGSNENAD